MVFNSNSQSWLKSSSFDSKNGHAGTEQRLHLVREKSGVRTRTCITQGLLMRIYSAVVASHSLSDCLVFFVFEGGQ